MKKNFVGVAFAAALMAGAFAMPTHAATVSNGQWQQVDGSWTYKNADGSQATNAWAASNGQWFYLGDNGKLVVNTVVSDDNNNKYYVDSDGAMVTNGWRQLSTDDGDAVWYYFGADGKALTGRSDRLSKKVIDGKTYAFDENGAMLTGFVKQNGETVNPDSEDTFAEAMYYFGADGAMYQNQWLRYEDVGLNAGYSDLAQRNYSEYDEMWLYFDQRGKKVAARDITASKVREINGKNYAFDENGIMIPRLAKIDATLVATRSNADIRYGSEDKDGEVKGDHWAFMVPNEDMDADDYNLQEYSWFRTNNKGKVYKDRIKEVNGRKYAFDEIGRMQTQFVVMFRNGTFAKQFDTSVFDSEDFLVDNADSDIPGIDRGNLYLFGADELNDGSMKTGTDIPVELADKLVYFGFKNSGIAIGNRGQLEKYKSKYYFNGLRLDAKEDIGYGLVKDSRSGDYIVVDRNGKQVTGDKRVLQDAEGCWIVIKKGKFFARVDSGDKPRFKNGVAYLYDGSLDSAHRYVRPLAQNEGANDSGFLLFE